MDRGSFDDFVTTRSTRLLRTAYLLTHDRALAEDLVQTSLAKAWFAWAHIEGQPDAYVRRVMSGDGTAPVGCGGVAVTGGPSGGPLGGGSSVVTPGGPRRPPRP